MINLSEFFSRRGTIPEAPFIRGGERHPYVSPGAAYTVGTTSLILAKAVIGALSGDYRTLYDDGRDALLLAKVSSASSCTCKIYWQALTPDVRSLFAFPCAEDGANYHLGQIGLVAGLFYEKFAPLIHPFGILLEAFIAGGRKLSPDFKPLILQTSDSLYAFFSARKEAWSMDIGDVAFAMTDAAVHDRTDLLQALGDLDAFNNATGRDIKKGEWPVPEITFQPTPKPEPQDEGFVGPQVGWIRDALRVDENILLAGPTGSGKTMATFQAAREVGLPVTVIEGKDGLVDLDFLGAILPQPDGNRRWVDGPLLCAMRQAMKSQLVLFLDELNRIPRHQLNILIGLMNPKRGRDLANMGLSLVGDGKYYLVEVPMTSERVACPVSNLRIVAAGNFGTAYAVYSLDPALRRRFETIIDFTYPDIETEKKLVMRNSGLTERLAMLLCRAAAETRRLMADGTLPGCVDTATLLNWAAKLQREGAVSLAGIIATAQRTWADQVVGRDHSGALNMGSFEGLVDYFKSQSGGLK
jgi:MoxR-like ATPase